MSQNVATEYEKAVPVVLWAFVEEEKKCFLSKNKAPFASLGSCGKLLQILIFLFLGGFLDKSF